MSNVERALHALSEEMAALMRETIHIRLMCDTWPDLERLEERCANLAIAALTVRHECSIHSSHTSGRGSTGSGGRTGGGGTTTTSRRPTRPGGNG